MVIIQDLQMALLLSWEKIVSYDNDVLVHGRVGHSEKAFVIIATRCLPCMGMCPLQKLLTQFPGLSYGVTPLSLTNASHNNKMGTSEFFLVHI